MKIKITFGIVIILNIIIAQISFAEVTVDGFCYLENATNYSGTQVLFIATSPSAVTDTTYTNADGSFQIGISEGIYSITYSHDGWQPYTIPGGVCLFEDTTLPEVTLPYGSIIEVSGSQSGIWTSYNIYKVIGSITVNNQNTLTIEPGVTIQFMGYHKFTVYGTLIAEGTENDSIYFTSGQSVPSNGDWNTIKFENTLNNNSKISYTKIEYANIGIHFYNSSPTISNNTIMNNTEYGISCVSSSNPIIMNNKISNNDHYGTYGIICSTDSSPYITNNIISRNYYFGIYCINGASPNISNNTIIYNAGGIDCRWSSASISNNVISYNNGTGIICGKYCYSIISNNLITNNGLGIIGGDGITLEDYNAPTIKCNIISDNASSGIFCMVENSPIIKNNTIVNNPESGIWLMNRDCFAFIHNNIIVQSNYGIVADSPPTSLEYNLFDQNNHDCIGDYVPSYFGQIVTVNANGDPCDTYMNLFMDPLFADPLNGDYHLSWANYPIPDATMSPCIDAGDPSYPFDPDGTIVDMGALYFHQTQLGAEFSADETLGFSPLSVQFTDLSTSPTSILSWQWDFQNDGNIDSYDQHPEWIYSERGIYTVSLTISDGTNTDTETKVDYITVGGFINIPSDYSTIQEGINAANNADIVLVEPGIYVENINYNGKNITVASLFLTTQDDSYIAQTVIDGDSVDSVVKFSGGEDSTAVLTGFTIRNGNAAIYGGGICCINSSPIIKNVTIVGNVANNFGGGVCCIISSPSIKNVTITDNNANNNGGGIYCLNNSFPNLVNSILWNDSPQEIYFSEMYRPNMITISYSDVDGGEDGIVTNDNGTINWLTGNIDANPLFVDQSNGDYHLSWVHYPNPDSTMSPCINAGDPNTPLDPDSTIADIGTYYFNHNISNDNPSDISDCTIRNFPNPIKNSTTFLYSLKENSHVNISIFNIKGQLLNTLVDAKKPKGKYSLMFDTGALCSGIYFYKMQTENKSEIRKMIVIK